MTKTIDTGAILSSQRHLFEIPDNITYLNCAALSPQLRSVSAAGLESVRAKTEPWRISSRDWFTGAQKLREIAASVIGTDAVSLALIPSVSYGIAVAAANVTVEHGQSIVLLNEEFPSNYYAWNNLARDKGADLKLVRRAEGDSWTAAVLDGIDENTAVVSVPNCHWTDGTLVDLVKVGEKARSVGAALVVDASQSLGAYPIDIDEIQPDFLVSVGYKWLMGPFALGYMYISPKWQQIGHPIENSWLNRAGSEDFSSLVLYTENYEPGARRFDMGEFPNFTLVPMAIAALSQIDEWQVSRIGNTLSRLTNEIAERALEIGFCVQPPSNRITHFIGITLPDGIPSEVAEQLAQENIYVSIRGKNIRIAPHLYNDKKDIGRLFSILQKAI